MVRQSQALLDVALAVAICTGVAGCGGNDGPATAPVTGTITYNGEPLANATVAFAPENGGQVAKATTDEQGRYELGTFDLDDGALVGAHRVTVVARGPVQPLPPGQVPPGTPLELAHNPGKPLIPQKYFMQDTSGLTAEVVAGESNEFDFELRD